MNRHYNRKIILEDGGEFYGYSFGTDREAIAEIVFNTSMVGYQEILSDPSYTGQAVVMTYPLIGNYGILYRFRRICPEVTVELRMVDHALEPFELLESGQTDVIFASRQNYSFCDWTPLYNEKMYAILPKDYPLGDRAAFPLEEFSDLEFLMPYGRFDIDVKAALEPVGVKLNATTTRVDDETLIRMVGRGLGVSMMTELMIRGRTDDVLCVPVTPSAIRELGMGTHLRKKETDSIRKLKECMLQFLADKNLA